VAVGSAAAGSVAAGSVEVDLVEVDSEEAMELHSNNPNLFYHYPNTLGRPCIRFVGSI
jgi:hypothetical protein